jgi:succinate dehydrogenase / fumarate reductase membrane anchor subunit
MSADRNMRTPLARVRGRGAGGGGTSHFIAQRATAAALALLAPWFAVTAGLAMRDGGYVSAIDFLAQPGNAVGVILLALVGLYHMALGMQDVIVDYIHAPFVRVLLLLINVLVSLALGAGAVFAVLLVNFGA